MRHWSGLLFILLLGNAFAFDNPYYVRSPKGLLMGDAFTAVSDDDYSLFYNPASLARHSSDFSFYPLNGHLSGTNLLDDLDRFEDLPSEPVPMADLLMDYPAHASAGITPGFKLFNFGVSFIVNESYDLLLRNKAHPMMDVDLRSDRGVAFGIGIPLDSSLARRSKRKKKKVTSSSGAQTSLGLGAKYIQRTGIKDTLALAGPTVINAMGKDDLKDLVNSLGEVKGRGWGFDAGIEHVYRAGTTEVVIGLAALDITGTEFKVDKNTNPDNLKVANNRDQINLGFAWKQDFKLIDFSFAADIRALNEQMDFGKRVRLGAQVGLPGLRFMGGVNSGYYSYGAQLNLGLFRLTGGFYEVELGSTFKQIKGKRFIIYLSLFDFSFDA